jgi:uncharacterized protein DUF3854
MKNQNSKFNCRLPPFKKGKRTCPVCGKTTDWHCSVTIDGSLALCSYRWNYEHANDGRYIHRLNDLNLQTKQTAVSTSPIGECGSVEVPRADADLCDAVNRALLESLELTDAHGSILLDERGLSDTTIAANLYASVPSLLRAREVCDELSRRFDLAGVPGFYMKDGLWRLRYYGQGFYVPYRDAQGRMVGLQVRLDEGKPRYIWLSTGDACKFPLGASSGAPVHFSKPDLTQQSGFAFVTEGALKSDRIAEFTDNACVGIAGVDAFKGTLGADLREALPQLHTVEIVYDAEWQEKPEVKKALLRLGRILVTAGLSVKVREWAAVMGKGFDDYLFQLERKTNE